MKIVGCLVIVISLALYGKVISKNIINRVKYIEFMLDILEFIKNEMIYNMSSVSKIINKIIKCENFKKFNFINEFSEKFESGLSVKESWKYAIQNSDIYNVLKKDDLEVISKIGIWLGNSSIEGQVSNIKLTSQYLNYILVDSKEYKKKYYKIYNTLGILFGLALVILIW